MSHSDKMSMRPKRVRHLQTFGEHDAEPSETIEVMREATKKVVSRVRAAFEQKKEGADDEDRIEHELCA